MTMHRTHAGHGSIWPAETSKKSVEARASLDAAERASRAREDALREAADVGDCIHAIEWHKPDGEYAEGYRASAADYQAAIFALIDKPKGGDRG